MTDKPPTTYVVIELVGKADWSDGFSLVCGRHARFGSRRMAGHGYAPPRWTLSCRPNGQGQIARGRSGDLGISDRFGNQRAPHLHRSFPSPFFSEIEIATTKLEQMGFDPFAEPRDFDNPVELLRKVSAIFKFISPLLRVGDIEKAKRLSTAVQATPPLLGRH